MHYRFNLSQRFLGPIKTHNSRLHQKNVHINIKNTSFSRMKIYRNGNVLSSCSSMIISTAENWFVCLCLSHTQWKIIYHLMALQQTITISFPWRHETIALIVNVTVWSSHIDAWTTHMEGSYSCSLLDVF